MNYGIELRLTESFAEVGGRITGDIRRAPQSEDSNDPVRAVRISLQYSTEGRGDTDSHTASGVEIPVDANGSLSDRFELVVPAAGPISYDGRLMRVAWVVEARLDVKLRRDIKVYTPVLVVPKGGYGLYDRPHPWVLR